MDSNSSPFSRVFGRRKGRPLRIRKSRLIDELLPELLIKLPASKQLAPQELFHYMRARQLWMEIGFGGGEHLAAQAKEHADVAFIGCEPFLNGVAGLLDHLDRDHIQNVRIFNDDARQILDALPDATLDKCFILFADPWPKKRHAERRFVGADNLKRLARVLKPDALLRLASDHPQLVDWMRECMTAHSDFSSIYDSPIPPLDWIATRYQKKAIAAGRQPIFMDYRRR